MTKRIELEIIYKNGNSIKELVNYIHFEDNALFYTVDKQVHSIYEAPVRIPIVNIKSFDLRMIVCDGWEKKLDKVYTKVYTEVEIADPDVLADSEAGYLTLNDARSGRPVVWYKDESREAAVYADTLEILSEEDIENELL